MQGGDHGNRSPLSDGAAVAIALGLAALLYSTIGHAGASGYLAAMALLGVAPAAMRPTALALNLVVASIGSFNFIRAGHLKVSLLWPFLLTSVPMAYLGGRMALPVESYRAVIGIVLVISAVRFMMVLRQPDQVGRQPHIAIALTAGAALGFLAGLTGVGGGIFLSPLLLMSGWADLRTTAATSVVFILANSAAGLLGQLSTVQALPAELPLWALIVAVMGWLGSYLGAKRLPSPAIRGALAAVLLVAGLKLLL